MKNTVQIFFKKFCLCFIFESDAKSAKMLADFLMLLKIVEHQHCQHGVPLALCWLVLVYVFKVTMFLETSAHCDAVKLFNTSKLPKNRLKRLLMFHKNCLQTNQPINVLFISKMQFRILFKKVFILLN